MIDFGIDVPSHIECVKDSMYVEELEVGEKTTSWGFEIPEEKMDYLGEFVRPRWAKVVYKSDSIKDIDVGDWILQKHGHWSSTIVITKDGVDKNVWYISPKSYKEGLIAKSKEIPSSVLLYHKK